MILDKQLVLSDAQAITSTANSTNVIDLATIADISRGEPLRFRVQVDTAFTDTSSDATLTIALVCSADTSLGTPTTLYTTGAVAFASMSAAGTILVDVVIPRTSLRYLGVIYTVASGPFTAGNLTAAVLLNTETPIPARSSNFNTGF